MMKQTHRNITRRGAAFMVAALVLFGAMGTAMADIVDQDVQLTIQTVRDGARQSAVVVGKYDDEADILYVPAQILFRAAGAEWILRDDKVYFPVGRSVASVETLTEDGILYVPALDTLSKLGVQRSLAGNILGITVW